VGKNGAVFFTYCYNFEVKKTRPQVQPAQKVLENIVGIAE
jgi:hypothetical protein